ARRPARRCRGFPVVAFAVVVFGRHGGVNAPNGSRSCRSGRNPGDYALSANGRVRQSPFRESRAFDGSPGPANARRAIATRISIATAKPSTIGVKIALIIGTS